MMSSMASRAKAAPRLMRSIGSAANGSKRQCLSNTPSRASGASRRFATRSPLLLTPPSSHTLLRPQLPFLHAPASSAILLRQPMRAQLRRPISTNQRSYYQKIYEGLKVALSCYFLVLLYHVIRTGLHQERIERIYPTPRSWSLWSRWRLRTARSLQDPGRFGKLAVDWTKVAGMYAELLERLEDEAIDGAGLVPTDQGAEGETIYDTTGKSAEWREGYFHALMGAATAAEKMDGWVRDTESGDIGPSEYVVGPSNPYDRTSPPRRDAKIPTLREEHCVQAYNKPRSLYMKILNTEGFRDNQKLDAALAYADWLDYKDSKEEASKMYSIAMDIAASGLGPDRKKVVDERTGVLKEKGDALVTENLLRASTAMAVHQVRLRDLSTALSAFLSILRARRALPNSSSSLVAQDEASNIARKHHEPSVVDKILSWVKESEYVVPSSTGNETPSRSRLTACEEAGLMVYIGEILFSSSSQQDGLAWTRDAVDIAESTLLMLSEDDESSDKGSLQAQRAISSSLNHAPAPDRCRDCLKAGLDNWSLMVRQLVRQSEKKEYESIRKVRQSNFMNRWISPLFGSGPEKAMRREIMERRRWEAEQAILTDRTSRARWLLGDQGFETMGVSDILL